jgi:hypothetical protein
MVSFRRRGRGNLLFMSTITHLKWGEKPTRDSYLMIRRIGRVRGDDYFVDPCDGLAVKAASVNEPRAFASLNSALRAAESRAEMYGVDTIYVRMGG